MVIVLWKQKQNKKTRNSKFSLKETAHLQLLKAQITQGSFQGLSLLSAHYRRCISGIVGGHLGGWQPHGASCLLSWRTVCAASSEAHEGSPVKRPTSTRVPSAIKAGLEYRDSVPFSRTALWFLVFCPHSKPPQICLVRTYLENRISGG